MKIKNVSPYCIGIGAAIFAIGSKISKVPFYNLGEVTKGSPATIGLYALGYLLVSAGGLVGLTDFVYPGRGESNDVKPSGQHKATEDFYTDGE